MQHITASALKQKLHQGENIFLLDVREPFEHEDFNIGGTLIPLNDIVKQVSLIPKDKSVVVYCRKGVRSQIAIQRLQQKFSFNNLINLQGGIESWKNL